MKLGFASAILGLAVSTGLASAQANLSAETASPGGVAYLSTSSLAEAASVAGVANIQVSDGQTLTNSLQNVAEGKTDITASPIILSFLMKRGVGPYGKLGPEKGAELADKLAVLYTYNLGVFTLAAFDSSGLNGWESIEGKTIFNGPPRGGALNNARAVIKLSSGLDEGKGYKGLQVNWGQAVSTITGGEADGWVLPTNFPDGRQTRSVASGAITVWSTPKAVIESASGQKYGAVPGNGVFQAKLSDLTFAEGVTPVSEDDTFRGFSTLGAEIVGKSMDFETAKTLTAAFISHLDKIRVKTPFAGSVYFGSVDPAETGMCNTKSVKYHPGAVAAWEEAGYSVPDCAR